MNLRAQILCLLWLVLLAGCASAPSGTWSSPMPRSAGEYMPPEGPSFATPPANERPGLATRWGDTRESRVVPTTFERRDSSPSAQQRVLYNNPAGLEALWAQGYAGRPEPFPAPWSLGDVEWGVRGADGAWLPAWRQGYQWFVEGRSGERYSVVVRNRSGVRREVLVSVDGLDVQDGAPASYRRRGYVLQPGEEFAIEGFRKSSDAVAAFVFGSVSESYAEQRHGKTRNVGVIGLAVFEERDRNAERRLDADAFPGRWATPPPTRVY
jgi:hypothetical protein